MRITATVMAHPKRKKEAEALALDLRSYPFTDVWITWDEKNSEWDTGSRAVASGANKGDYHLVIQDDALLTPYFYENIEGALDKLPIKTLVSLYVGQCRPFGSRVTAAIQNAGDATWLKHYILLWGVAILIPSDHIDPLLEYVEDERFNETPYDVRIGQFYLGNRLPVYYTLPSLVDHNEAIGSLLDHDADVTEPRVAHRLADGLVLWSDLATDI